MTKREETPDVLGKLLGGQAPEKPAEKEKAEEKPKAEAPSEERPPEETTSKPARQEASKPVAPPPTDEKVKATYYLSPETLDFLESAWLKLRRLVGQDKRGQVSKSLIVEMALQVTLDDLRVRNEKSDIAEAIRRAVQEE